MKYEFEDEKHNPLEIIRRLYDLNPCSINQKPNCITTVRLKVE
jgi:hypothetical protein